MKKIAIIAVAVVAFLVVFLTITRTLWPSNIADTSPDNPDERLRTRRYAVDLPTFATETEKLIPTLVKYGANWKFAGRESGDDKVVLKAEVPVVVFTDDLRVTAVKDPSAAGGGVMVDVHSNSRVGKSDFGENRRHLLIILDALDKKFGR